MMRKWMAWALLLLSSGAHGETFRDKAARFNRDVAAEEAAWQECLVVQVVQLGGGNTASLDDLWEAAHQACGEHAGRVLIQTAQSLGHADPGLVELVGRRVDLAARPQASLALLRARAR